MAAPQTVRRLEIAVSRAVTGNPPRHDILLAAADGRRARLLVRSESGDASWSPDGKRIAFASMSGGDEARPRSDIFLANGDGSGRRRVTDSGRAFSPVWSPDGRVIVYAEFAPGPPFPPKAALWAADVETGSRRQLSDAVRSRMDVPSSFAGDGTLAFTRLVWKLPSDEGRLENDAAVYLLDLRTGEARRLIDHAEDAAFSPDGRTVVFASNRDRNGELSYGDVVFYASELYAADADGANPRRLTRTRNINDDSPSWSPDGRLIAYRRGEVVDNAEASSVLVMRADGSCVRRVAFDPGLSVWYADPAWRPGSVAPLACRSSRPARPLAVEPAGNLSIAGARRFRAYPLYWLGRRFGDLVLSSLSRSRTTGPGGRAPVVGLIYGSVQIQHWAACARAPGDVDVPTNGTIRIGRARGFFFDDGNRLEVVTGKTNIVIFGNRRTIVRVARALRPLNPPLARRLRRGGLPAPAPGAVTGKLRCR